MAVSNTLCLPRACSALKKKRGVEGGRSPPRGGGGVGGGAPHLQTFNICRPFWLNRGLEGGLRGGFSRGKKIVVGVAAVVAVVRGGLKGGLRGGKVLVGHKKKIGRVVTGTNRSVDVSNIICLTACVFGLKKAGGSRGGAAGAEPPHCKLLTFVALV